jgi:predicted nuclease of restriction endonuclease-like RecB superfamily
MLTGKMVRVRYARDRIVPYYLDVTDESWRLVAEQLLELFREQQGKTRGDLEGDIQEAFGDDPGKLVHQGLAKLLEDRCEFEVVSGHPPEKVRAAVFRAAARQRKGSGVIDSGADQPGDLRAELAPFDRTAVLEEAATELGIPVKDVEDGLFADLKSEQRLISFKDLSAEHLLERYNVALAQAVLLRAIRVHVTVRNEPPQRYRQLLRRLKFHRLLCEMERSGPDSYQLHIDGPLSLFSATQKYGLQLALFLPGLLLCRNFELRAELRWGAQRKPKTFLLKSSDGLVSHAPDTGMYVPAELGMFVELFRKRIDDWELVEETELYPLGNEWWVPDFRLVHRASKQVVLLEVLGFWRRSHAEKHLQYLRRYAKQPFLLAVSDQLHIDEGSLDDLPAGIHRFRNMPLPDEVARLANEMIKEI